MRGLVGHPRRVCCFPMIPTRHPGVDRIEPLEKLLLKVLRAARSGATPGEALWVGSVWTGFSSGTSANTSMSSAAS
jgi:hypothetical protein